MHHSLLILRFNSTMVRLKEYMRLSLNKLFIGFNSTMVRLKASHRH